MTAMVQADKMGTSIGTTLRTLADTGCTQATVFTLTYIDEAVGIVRAATAAGFANVTSPCRSVTVVCSAPTSGAISSSSARCVGTAVRSPAAV